MNREIKRIGLFMGGSSSEKEISLETGRHVYNNLDQSKFEIYPIFVDQKHHLWLLEEGLLWMNTCSDVEDALKDHAHRWYYEDLIDKIDYSFLALHGKYGEECIPALLELYGIPNNSSGVLGGSIGMDKVFQRNVLKAYGCDIAPYSTVTYGEWNNNKKEQIIKEIENTIGYPFVVKPSREGCSVAISKVKERKEIELSFQKAFGYDNTLLVEKYITGKEVTTTVIEVNYEPMVLTPTETPCKGDFLSVEEKFLPGDATMITPPNVSADVVTFIKEESLRAYKALEQHNASRIDGIYSEGKIFILEPNSPPGMTPSTMVFHQAAEEGWNASQFFEKVIQNSIS